MKNLIYQRSAPDMVLISISVTPDGNIGHVSNNENEAMLFDSEGAANETIITLVGGTQFWTINGLGQQNNGINATTFEWSKIGLEFLTNWQLYGQLAEIIIYSGKPPDSIIETDTFTQNTKFNI